MKSLVFEYRGTNLEVELNAGLSSLRINGLVREKHHIAEENDHHILSSTVQTDYEWHEFIEAEINVAPDQSSITLRANAKVLIEETFPGGS